MITLLVAPELFERDAFEIEGDEYRHLFRARRLATGARVRVVDGQGHARWAIVDHIARRCATLTLGENAPTHEPSFQLHLVVAALRPERASWLIEKTTELGVVTIRFVASQRTPRRYGSANLGRWRRVAAAALQQSHGATLPHISGVDTWDDLVDALASEGSLPQNRYLLDTSSDAESWHQTESTSGLVLVGPEGGWSPEEAQQLTDQGCRPASLGPRTLRVETAAVAAAVRLLTP